MTSNLLTSELPQLTETGAIHLEFSTTIDCPLLEITGDQGHITLAIKGGRIDGYVSYQGDSRRLDAEDTLGVTDGAVHSITLSADTDGTHLFYDGYEAFTLSVGYWLAHIQADSVAVNPQGLATLSRAWARPEPVNYRQAPALAPAAMPSVSFAADHLSAYDTARLSCVKHGSIVATMRTRGRGQGGVIIMAKGTHGVLRVGIDDGDITFQVQSRGEVITDLRAPGNYDDGITRDIAVTSGYGAVEIHVDGMQILHEPGEAFFSNLGDIIQATCGRDLDGSRLFGEVTTAQIFDTPLGDHQLKRLSSAPAIYTRALFDTGMLGSRSYRIPSIITTQAGTVIAGADQRVSIPNDSPNDINFTIRRSTDNAVTFSDPKIVLSYPGEGATGASVIDSVLVQDTQTGRVLAAIDHFPGAIGQPNCEPGTGFTSDGLHILHQKGSQDLFILLIDGTVTTIDGSPTDFRVAADGTVVESSGGTDHELGNIYLAESEVLARCLLTHRSSYVQIITSDDEGETWSKPRDITSQIKEEWMRFMGTSPGNGIQLHHGDCTGRILVPVYYNHKDNAKAFSCAVIFSDDGGQTWSRGASPNDGRDIDGCLVDSQSLDNEQGYTHESTIVETPDGVVHMWMRNQNSCGRVAHSQSNDGGESFGPVSFVEGIPEIFSQPNAIAARSPEGKDAVVFANASQMLPFRGRGCLRVSFDGGLSWKHNTVFQPRHYVYQCMTQLPDGSIALLWERELQGLYVSIVPWEWLSRE